jgi:hypothetical protein
MQPIPDDILKQLNAVLEQKAVLSSLRYDYRKWLRYYLDFQSIFRAVVSIYAFIPGSPYISRRRCGWPSGIKLFARLHNCFGYFGIQGSASSFSRPPSFLRNTS